MERKTHGKGKDMVSINFTFNGEFISIMCLTIPCSLISSAKHSVKLALISVAIPANAAPV